MKKKRVITKVMAMLLTFAVVLSMMPVGAVFGGENDSINAYVTISCEGVIAKGADNTLMAGVPVSVNDEDSDGKVTVDEVMRAIHEKYCEGGYATLESDHGTSVTKLWGKETYNTLFFVNNAGINTGVAADTVSDGDYVVASVNSDDINYADWYTYFNDREIEVFQGEEFELQLKGHLGMAYTDADKQDISISNVSAGQVSEAGFQAIEGKTTDKDGKVKLSFTEPGTYYVSANGTVKDEVSDWTAAPYDGSVKKTADCPIIAPYCKVTVKEYNVNITVPEDAQLYVAEKPNNKHYVAFSKFKSSFEKDNGDGTRTVSYNLTANKKYNYRVWGNGYVTYANIFTSPKASADAAQIAVTDDMLRPKDKTSKTVDRNLTSNNGYNVADIYLNINEKGHLKINKGETYQIVNLRNWEAIDTIVNNYFIEPDYSYTVIDENGGSSDVVEIDENGLLTAKKDGTAIVLVTYDSINAASATGGPFFGAIWPENTGVFAVTVGGVDSGITSGMKINEGKNAADTSAGKLAGDNLDAEHDVIYFLTAMTDAEGNTEQIENACGEYTFTPEGAETVEIANPVVSDRLSFNGFKTVSKNKDGSYTVKLTEGRNIVKLSNEKGSEYQVITAKGVTATVNNVTSPGKALTAGDAFSVKFSTVYHPANKLAGVYNMSAGILYGNVEGYDEGITFGGTSNQYNFASTEKAQTVSNQVKWEQKGWLFGATQGDKLTVPASYDKAQLTMSDGYLIAAGYGDPYGNHRGITLTDGKAPNLNASIKVGYMGKLPDITVEIKKDAAVANVKSIEVTKQPEKTSYYEGDVFDASGMEIEVTYEDDSKRTVAGGFEYDKTPLGKGTDKVTVGFGGKTAEIAISVQELVLEQISIDTPPAKTEYVEGEYFNPSGMVVKAEYNSGKTVEITDYTYSKEALKKGDAEVVINYENKTVAQTITVSERTVIPADNISVKFTLMGDSEHGDNGQVHTLRAGNLTTWIAQTSVEAAKDATVLDIVEKVLAMNGMGFKNADGNYISEVNGLGEFDNGANSGWMYTLNGSHPSLGVAEQTLKNGDVIVFHYTDDYTREEGSENWSSDTKTEETKTTVVTDDKSGSTATTAPTETKVTEKTNADGTKEKTATVMVSADNQTEIIKQAADKKSADIVLDAAASDTDGADNIQLQINVSFVRDISEKTGATLTVSTENGIVSLDRDTIKTVLDEAKGSVVTIDVNKVANPDELQKKAAGANGQILSLTVKSGDKVISDFRTGKVTVTVAISAALQNKRVAAVHIAEDGKIEQLPGKNREVNDKKYFEFTTSHFSDFALVDADELGLEAEDEKDTDKAKSLIKELKLSAVSSKTSKKNVKITVKMNSKNKALIKELSDMGYTVKYKYYRSVKKASKYTAVKTKTSKTYINTAGKKGTKYYYKVRVAVYDGNKVVAQSALKQCSYAARTWSK